ncbi:MAP/microtubule affinity-regulating kinase 4-like [Tupaia chinensis]|uniref:MAP/microtubule affinity-regulating kinase 4-like n=1 Tax=Tupaia chinensis TaxID=246437 RepID=UPI0003C8EDF8|nr:MAP/microtubule affinity-regulating kinase 4-like [Tupaia chinensis]
MPLGNQFAFLETLGQGSFAKVKLAWHFPTCTEVAVKIMEKEDSESTAFTLQTLYNEAAIMMSLQHPNVLRMVEMVDTDHALYLVMEYARGGSLQDHLTLNGPLGEEEARGIFLQVAEALQYCHRQGVAHRDLKPANILGNGRGAVKLADFGLSVRFSTGLDMEVLCGTPAFLAPELFLQEDSDDRAVDIWAPALDIWAFGVSLYNALTDLYPFGGETLKELRQQILACQFAIPSYLSAQVRDLLANILKQDPRHRLTLQQIIQHPWFDTDVSVAFLSPNLPPHLPVHDSRDQEASGEGPARPASLPPTLLDGPEAKIPTRRLAWQPAQFYGSQEGKIPPLRPASGIARFLRTPPEKRPPPPPVSQDRFSLGPRGTTPPPRSASQPACGHRSRPQGKSQAPSPAPSSPAAEAQPGASACTPGTSSPGGHPQGPEGSQHTASASPKDQGCQGLARKFISCLRENCCIQVPKSRPSRVAPAPAKASNRDCKNALRSTRL